MSVLNASPLIFGSSCGWSKLSVSMVRANINHATTVAAVGQGFLGSLTVIRSLLQQLLLSLLLLQSDAVFALQPRLCWLIDVGLLVLLELWEKCGEAGDSSGLALLRRMVTRRHPSECWARREKRKEVWWELVGHLADELEMSLSKKRQGIDEVAMFAKSDDCLETDVLLHGWSWKGQQPWSCRVE